MLKCVINNNYTNPYVDYLLKMKNENDYTIAYLKELNNNYLKMKEETIFYLIDTSLSVNEDYIQYNKDITEINDNLNEQDNLLKQLTMLNEKIRKKITEICNHEWITDYIDIDPDRSKKIEYCKICEISR
jgi:hypothetical protein